ncbi:outer membrane beta-barrel protein [Longimicrobium terrae]|uniref:Putative porin n=1 Tax=Longimicrobium terrae TaxID=1639882 RepID=A0A841GXZ0_9BACT|nr:putative porin [Longimicrobium terrae]MBB6070613.1 putative porin [Longimicrobium terrae]NNC29598.1 outer membrane beta-barrel protein [Longimicrobium terrae]
MNKKLIFSVLVAGTALTSTGLSAQVSKNAGLLLNAHVLGSGLTIEDEDAEGGVGAGITAGYGFNENLSIYLTVDGAKMKYDEGSDPTGEETYTLAQADLGLRYTFGSTANSLRPYLNAAVSGVSRSDEFDDTDFTLTGPAGTFGAGLQYFFSPSLALDTNLQVSLGKFNKYTVDGDDVDFDDDGEPSLTGSRLQVGLSWHP